MRAVSQMSIVLDLGECNEGGSMKANNVCRGAVLACDVRKDVVTINEAEVMERE